MRPDLVQAIDCIHSRTIPEAKIGIILGTGLGALVERIENPVKIAAAEIPHYPVSTVTGHYGNLIFGTLKGISLLVVHGRTHYYEGYPVEKITFVVRIMAGLGIKLLIVTNAAGAINSRFKPGDLMLITDQINLMFHNPLILPTGNSDYDSLKDSSPQSSRFPGTPFARNDKFRSVISNSRLRQGEKSDHTSYEVARFPDMSEAYSTRYFDLVSKVARANKIKLQRGVLCATTGPCYETAAEVRMMARLGADAVSMSVIPEVLVARQAGLEVIGISCITNPATGMGTEKLSHDDVTCTAEKVKAKFSKLIEGIIEGINKQ